MADEARTIKENQSFDSSFMNNGTIAEQAVKTDNAYFQINHFEFTIKPRKKREVDNKLPELELPTFSATRDVSRLTVHSLAPHCLKLRSKIDGSRVLVYATYDLALKSNWISAKIVKRLGLVSKHEESFVRASSRGRVLMSNGQSVSLSYSRTQGTHLHRERQEFLIMEGAPFDILFGAV